MTPKKDSAPCGLLGGRAASATTAAKMGTKPRKLEPAATATGQRPAPRLTRTAMPPHTGSRHRIGAWHRVTAIVRSTVGKSISIINDEHGGPGA